MKLLTILLIGLLTASFVRAQTAAPSSQPATQPSGTKIACVGDSITAGSGIKDPAHNGYPAQLQQMLGSDYVVKNFGVSGATLLKNGDKPYWKQKAFTNAQSFAPDIVVIKLGTNDSKPQNWKFKDEIKADLSAMVEQFQSLPSHPTVYVCHPVPSFPGNFGIRDDVMKNELDPLIDEVAKAKSLKVIDLYAPLSDKKELFPDKVHPNAEGARLIAGAVYTALTGKPAPATAPASTDAPATQPAGGVQHPAAAR